MNKVSSLLILSFLFTCTCSNAQQRNVSELPSWVAMIDQPETNYYDAIAVFDAYWKDKLKPEGEDERGKESKEEEKERRVFEKQYKNMSPAEREQYNLIKYHYKRFETWAREVKAYVQEDGRVLSQQERIELWKKQQQEIQQQKK